MQPIAGLIKRLSHSDIPVFLEGEHGCGKTFLAQYMHSLSPRNGHVFYVWDPRDESGSLQEVLFGSREQIGLIEMCWGGTLVIKNVEKLSFAAQGKLKHFLTELESSGAAGSDPDRERTAEGKADEAAAAGIRGMQDGDGTTRIIFTSSYSLTELLTKNLISSELYYAMGKATVSVPPIRQRPEDLAACIDYYLGVFNKKYGKEIALSDRAKALLLAYDWPGNIRDVRFLMERTVLINDSKQLGVYDLPENIVKHAFSMESQKTDLSAMMDFYEGQIVMRAYRKYGNSIAVAKELGISQSSAFRKLKKYVPDYREVPVGRRKKQS
ncbi:MAG: sigma-54-dependent Fis family transcriptional regulator [Lachnospiraceae bacterium]|nr:sigma-54-dependent Fis family transcriptional regulator [Lachnospiraceae bacterium]